jgi:replicative DNA helicase
VSRSEDRALPHSIEAEQSVLGACLVNPAAYSHAATVLVAGDFYRDAHRRLWNVFRELVERGDPLDFLLIKDALLRAGDLGDVGGPAYIASLMDGVPASTNVQHYAGIVKNDAARRALIYAANDAAARAYDRDDDPGSIAAAVMQGFDRAVGAGPASAPVVFGVDAVEQWSTMPPISTRALPLTVIPAIDDQMRGGLEPGECLTMLARPGSLKTMLVLNILRRWLARRPHEFFALVELEMPRRQLIERLARMHFALNSETLDHRRQRGSLDVDGFKQLLASLCIVDDVGLSLADIQQRIRLAVQHADSRPLGAVIIDHCGLVRASSGTSAYDRATDTAIGIKQLARRLEVPVVAIVQANRTAAHTSRAGDPPEMEQARDSGAYEENADFMLSLSAIQSVQHVDYVTVKLVKNRRGKSWITQVGFDPVSLRMAELADDGSLGHVA